MGSAALGQEARGEREQHHEGSDAWGTSSRPTTAARTSPRNAAAPSRARGSPLGLLVWAAPISAAAQPALRSARCPARLLLTPGLRLTERGWGAAWRSEGRWPRTMEAPCRRAGAPAPALLAVPMARRGCGHGDTRTGSSTRPPRAPARRICTTRCCSARAWSQINSPIKSCRSAAGPRGSTRRGAAMASGRAGTRRPRARGALWSCSGFYCLNPASSSSPGAELPQVQGL